jgi:NADPH:quinone reductase-like Zn-dependent oxidoreductase
VRNERVMKAVVQHRYGPPDVLGLEEIGRPAPANGQVLVRVRAASVNPADWHSIRGRPFLVRLVGYGLLRPTHSTPGTDVAGIVEAVGTDVTELRAGDEVFGWARGSYAEFAIARADRLARKPDTITFKQAAAVPTAAVTALQGLRDSGRLAAGHQTLVIGASGGVGTFAVQIAKAFGAEVTGVCSTGNVELVRSIGADDVIDYTSEDVVRSGRRYDLVFQLAGTRSPLELRRTLRPTGTLVLCSGDGRLSGLDRIALAAAASRFVRQRLVSFVAKQSESDLVTLKELIEAGSIRPILDRTYPLVETPEAIRYIEARHSRGKVVIEAWRP